MGTLPRAELPLKRMERYQAQMDEALRRVNIARLQIAEATTIDELDIGKATLQAAFAEVSRIVRLAKKEVGVPLRSVQEAEEQYQKMVTRFRCSYGEAEAEA